VQLPEVTGFVAVSSGLGHTVAVKSDGSVWAWGDNTSGQLGNDSPLEYASPVRVPGLTDVAAVAAGHIHTIAVKSDGSVWAWGLGHTGQLGDGTGSNRSSPVKLPGIAGVVSVAAGFGHTVAVKSDGSVWAWGYNDYGQLGDGTTANRWSPVQVPGIGGVVSVAAGYGHTVAVKSDGSVWAWGYNGFGQLGDGTTTNGWSPIHVPDISGVVSVAAGFGHTVAVKSDGSVWAWGYNRFGQLGDGTATNRWSPVQVPGIGGIIDVAAGAGAVQDGVHTVALKSDGSVWGWGWNHFGQLGDGTGVTSSSPVQVVGLTGVTAVAAGAMHSLALKTNGNAAAWGIGGAQLGDGTFAQRMSPVLVVNSSADGYLNLKGQLVEIPKELQVPFFLVATGGITDSGADVKTTTKFNADDLGKSGSVYVTARVPAGSLNTVLNATMKQAQAAVSERPMASVTNVQPQAAAPTSYILVQLTPNGWVSVSNGQLIPYASGVIGDQLAAQTILNGVDTTNLKGAEFCLGYGTDAQAMLAQGLIRTVATIPDPNATTPPTLSCLVGQVKDGLWAVDAEAGASGRGFQVEKRNGTMVFTYYGYGSDSNGLWALSAGAMNGSTYSGSMDRYQGGAALGGSYRAAATSGSAGTVRMDFSSPTKGSITFPGESPKAISKFDFSGSTVASIVPENGLWVINEENNGQPGRGFQIEQRGGTLILTYYGYGADGSNLWALSAGAISGTSYTGSMDRYRGGTVMGGNYAPATTAGSAGLVNLTFSSPSTGTITFPGEAAKSISKFVW
jgi:alpha-tubulin suppressor-like RCC1 family protein